MKCKVKTHMKKASIMEAAQDDAEDDGEGEEEGGDEADWRARWKETRHVQDGYVEVTVPWPDAKVAAALCKGKPIHYCVKERSGISEQWIIEHIAARVKQTYRDIGARCLLPDGQNPVEKLPYLFIELLLANDDDDLDGGDAK
eukprot:scaffold1169_cov146-Chaetoceros_neogracile.AAC.1